MLYLTPALTVFLFTLAAVSGAVMGSFLNCAAWRLVHGESVLRGRSHCVRCGHALTAGDLVPIVSWLALRGRCRYCGRPISARYSLTEALCAAVYCTLLLRFDVSWQFLRYAALLSALLLGALVDMEYRWIPDRVSVISAVLFVPLSLLEGGPSLLLSGLLGAATLFVPLLVIVLALEKAIKTEAMGGGDLKLFALLGLYFGWQQGIFLVLVSCILGLLGMALAGRLKKRVKAPFAPALYLAAWITALAGGPVLDWYMRLYC